MNDWQYLSLGDLEQNNFPQIKSWGFLVAEYPGSRGPFSKYLAENKPCLRFDNFISMREISSEFELGRQMGYSHVSRELAL